MNEELARSMTKIAIADCMADYVELSGDLIENIVIGSEADRLYLLIGELLFLLGGMRSAAMSAHERVRPDQMQYAERIAVLVKGVDDMLGHGLQDVSKLASP